MKITLEIGKKQTAIFVAILFTILSTSSAFLFRAKLPGINTGDDANFEARIREPRSSDRGNLFLQSDTNVKQQTKNQPTKVLSEKTSETAINSDQLVRVIRVIDGDTIEIEGGQKVRYIGIDTPETVHPDKTVQCFGIEASNKNKELVEGKQIKLEKDVSETDKYGRLLRYVYLENIFINDYLVNEGFAYASSYPPDIKYQNQFSNSQKEAEKNNRGLWGTCVNSGQQNFSQPQPANPNQAEASDCLIKGNISSSGEKIYHIPGQRYYEKTIIDPSKGEQMFCSEDDAIKEGWRKSKI